MKRQVLTVEMAGLTAVEVARNEGFLRLPLAGLVESLLSSPQALVSPYRRAAELIQQRVDGGEIDVDEGVSLLGFAAHLCAQRVDQEQEGERDKLDSRADRPEARVEAAVAPENHAEPSRLAEPLQRECPDGPDLGSSGDPTSPRLGRAQAEAGAGAAFTPERVPLKPASVRALAKQLGPITLESSPLRANTAWENFKRAHTELEDGDLTKVLWSALDAELKSYFDRSSVEAIESADHLFNQVIDILWPVSWTTVYYRAAAEETEHPLAFSNRLLDLYKQAYRHRANSDTPREDSAYKQQFLNKLQPKVNQFLCTTGVSKETPWANIITTVINFWRMAIETDCNGSDSQGEESDTAIEEQRRGGWKNRGRRRGQPRTKHY